MNYPLFRSRVNRARRFISRILKAIKYKKNRDIVQFSREFTMPVFSQSVRRAIEVNSKKYPVIFLHGVAPRSGTNYLNALLDKHPLIDSCPGEIYEFPFLTHIDQFLYYKDMVLDDYPRNRQNIVDGDISYGFGLSLTRYLHERKKPAKIPLLKEPSVKNLYYFHHLFPGHKLLLLFRDGRDVVQSTISSWPGWTLKEAADRWAKSAQVMLEYNERYAEEGGCLLVRYETLVENLTEEMARICNYLHIDEEIYKGEIEKSIPIIGSSTHSKVEGKVTWKAVDKSSGFKHKNKWEVWTEKQKKCFKKYAGAALIQAGYEENNNW